jgi:hypothetical protein
MMSGFVQLKTTLKTATSNWRLFVAIGVREILRPAVAEGLTCSK